MVSLKTQTDNPVEFSLYLTTSGSHVILFPVNGEHIEKDIEKAKIWLYKTISGLEDISVIYQSSNSKDTNINVRGQFNSGVLSSPKAFKWVEILIDGFRLVFDRDENQIAVNIKLEHGKKGYSFGMQDLFKLIDLYAEYFNIDEYKKK